MKTYEQAMIKCTLCPRGCGADRRNGSAGFCHADKNVKIARAALHFWEEPCISGKNGSGTVFFSNCTMKCVFCQNHEISTGGKGYTVSEKELAEIFLDLQSQGANNINLVTPTHYAPQIINSLDIAKSKGLNIPIAYNCGGYESVDTLRMFKGYIDIYMPDMKYYRDKYAIRYSSAPNYFNTAKAALHEMYSQVGRAVIDENGIMKKGMIVRHLMLPGLMLDAKKIADYLYNTYGDNIYISLMNQYTPIIHSEKFPELNRRTERKYYDALVNYCAEMGMENVFIQGEESANEEFIPEFYGENN